MWHHYPQNSQHSSEPLTAFVSSLGPPVFWLIPCQNALLLEDKFVLKMQILFYHVTAILLQYTER